MLDCQAARQHWRADKSTYSPPLVPGQNVWRVARARRAAVLFDGADYFGALRAAMLAAHDSIVIVGWDLDSRMRLVGPSGGSDDGLPETLAAFLSALVKRRPGLRVRLLLWDYSMVFALERELTPIVSFLWKTPPGIEICLDDMLPIGASHHQKIVLIDNALAFSGGLDLTVRRWDTSEHRPDDPLRTDPGGATYPPFHDMQMVVDGDAAAALGELARQRWERAACEPLRDRPSAKPPRDPWPTDLKPDFRNVDVGISRTLPHHEEQIAVREVAHLFEDMAARADRLIYIENQFITHGATAERLAQRMRERPELELVIVAPRDYHGWIERRVMVAGRLRFMRILNDSACSKRVRLLYPEVRAGERCEAVMVHSKVMIVDDEVLRIGSANLCNRSMGLDTECDLVVAATDDDCRRGIADLRDRLIAEHSGLRPQDVAEAINSGASVCRLLDEAANPHRRLVPIDDSTAGLDVEDAILDAMADPVEPIEKGRFAAAEPSARSRFFLVLKTALVLCALALVTLVWQLSPLAEPARIVQSLTGIADRPWAPAAVIAVFLLAEFVAFPVTLLIFATIAVFGGWTGALLAGTGAMASAVVTFAVGRRLGSRFLRRIIGPRINRVRRGLANRGVMAVAAVRLVPLAPFTVVNLVAGAVGLRFFDYAVGTMIGLMPGLLVMSALGQQIGALFATPSVSGILALAAGVAAWIALGVGLQFLVARYRNR